LPLAGCQTIRQFLEGLFHFIHRICERGDKALVGLYLKNGRTVRHPECLDFSHLSPIR
jgi:hypothetical protein